MWHRSQRVSYTLSFMLDDFPVHALIWLCFDAFHYAWALGLAGGLGHARGKIDITVGSGSGGHVPFEGCGVEVAAWP